MFAKIFALASLVSVSAFAPASRMATSSALKMSFEEAIGAQAPLVRSICLFFSLKNLTLTNHFSLNRVSGTR